ncbi:MAG: ABC transporter permease [Candidatus Nitrosocaldus sp.]
MMMEKRLNSSNSSSNSSSSKSMVVLFVVVVISLARALILDWLRSKTGVFFTILFPIMLMSILTLVFSDDSNRLDLYVKNLDVGSDGMPTELSRALISELESSRVISIKHISADVDVYEYVKHSSKRVLIIPEGFDASLREKSIEARMMITLSTLDLLLEQPLPDNSSNSSSSNGNSNSSSSNSNSSSSSSSSNDDTGSDMIYGRELLENWFALRASNDNDGPARLLLVADSSRDGEYEQIHGILMSILLRFQHRTMDAPEILAMDVNDVNDANIAGKANYYLPAVLAAFIMTNGILGTSGIAAEFKRKGMLKRLMSTPLSRLQWIIANMLTQTVLALILASMMICIAVVALNTSLPNAISIVVLAIGALCFTGLGMIIAGALKEPHAITGASNAIAFPMMFLSGVFWPLDSMPEYMQSIAYALPLAYFIDALYASMYSSSIIETVQSTFMLAVLTGAFILVGSYLTRWKQD